MSSHLLKQPDPGASLAPADAHGTGFGKTFLVGHAVLLAVLLTAADAVKPLHLDDPAYYANAEHLAQHPLDPYGFDIFWYEYPEPANAVLAPPVLPYWWALGIHLFGEQPVLWKLWLLPFSLLFTLSLASLFRRFAPDVAIPLLWLTVLSPTIFPNLNLMLDIPAQALALGAVCLFLHALDRQALMPALAAGVVAGLGMQTKYTAFTAPAVMVAAAVLQRRARMGLLAACVALAVFWGWEGIVYELRGQSHFLFALGLGDAIRHRERAALLLPLLIGSGAGLIMSAFVGTIGLGARRWAVGSGMMIVAIGYGLIAWQDWQRLVLGSFGGITWLIIGGVVWQTLRRRDVEEDADRSAELLLLLWLLIELAAYLTMSPHPALRRLIGMNVVINLLVGHWLAGKRLTPTQRSLIRAVVLGGVFLGAGYAVLDWWEARARQKAVADAMARVGRYDRSPATIWFTGHWGFQYYAERVGMHPIVADQSVLHRGDWVVLTLEGQDSQLIWLQTGSFTRVAELSVGDGIPFTTMGEIALAHHSGPRVRIGVGRMVSDCLAISALPPDLLVRWAAERHRPLPPASIASVERAMRALAEKGRESAEALPYLQKLTENENPAIHESARRAIQEISGKR